MSHTLHPSLSIPLMREDPNMSLNKSEQEVATIVQRSLFASKSTKFENRLNVIASRLK